MCVAKARKHCTGVPLSIFRSFQILRRNLSFPPSILQSRALGDKEGEGCVCLTVCSYSILFFPHAPNMAFLPSPESSHLMPGLQKCSERPRREGRAPPGPEQTSPALSWLCHLLRYPLFCFLQSSRQNHSWRHLRVGKGFPLLTVLETSVHDGGKIW